MAAQAYAQPYRSAMLVAIESRTMATISMFPGLGACFTVTRCRATAAASPSLPVALYRVSQLCRTRCFGKNSEVNMMIYDVEVLKMW